MRVKLFTLDNRLIAKRLGTLDATDQARVSTHLRECLATFGGDKPVGAVR